MIDKALVRKSFDKAAKTYNRYARLQLDTAQKLLRRLEYITIEPKTILDIGSGTGFITQGLRKKFPKAKIVSLDLSFEMLKELQKNTNTWFKKSIAVCADAEKMPFQESQFDLIISGLTFQWCEDAQRLFKNIQYCLKTEGLLLFSSFGTDTLKELREAWQECDAKNHVNEFEDMHNIGDVLINMGYYLPVMDAERVINYYPSVIDLMKELKGIGAHNVDIDRKKVLTGKQGFDKMIRTYERLRTEQGLPATYEVIYGIGWKKEITMKPSPQVIEFNR